MFLVLAGPVIWVCFEKQTHMIEGENDRPATGSRRPRGRRFRHFRRPGCGVPATPATICFTRVRRRDAASGLSVQSVDCIRPPFEAVGGTAPACMTAVFIAGWNI